MLNIGQIVYDFNNKRTIIFGGFKMLQDQKTDKCTSHTRFFNEKGDIEDYNEICPFKYANFPNQGPDNKIPLGSLVSKAKLSGYYFGILKDNLGEKNKTARRKFIKEVIQEVEKLNLIKPIQEKEIQNDQKRKKRKS
jgi:hypothetical protein